jgi:Flp pilus assembly protein TadG
VTKLPWRRRLHGRGQALVEFALVLSVVVMVLLLAIDLGRAYFTYVGVRNAAREAAVYGGYNRTESCPGLSYDGIGYAVSKELQRSFSDIACGSGAANKVVLTGETGCFEFTAPNTYVACPAATSLLQPTSTYVYRVRIVVQFQPLTPLVGFLSGNGFGGRIPISVVTSSPVLSGYQ